jgi:hypothetical protein
MTSVHRARACRARLAGHPGPEWCIPGIGPMTRAAVALLLLAVVTAPLAARAQPAPRVSRIGILWLNPVSATGHLLEAFRQGLRELGYVEGQNFTIEFRSASALQPPVRVVAQRDPVQCAEGITRRERTRRGCDQRVHRNPATLVTPTVRYPGPKSIARRPTSTS